MIVIRASEVLASIRDVRDPGLSAEEQADLESNQLVSVVSSRDREDMRSSLIGMDPLAQKVRTMCRSGDVPGPISDFPPVVEEKGGAIEELPAAIAELESMVSKKVLLDSLALNAQTNSYVTITLAGRNAIKDFSAWSARYGQLELREFLKKMTDIRDSMMYSVKKASSFVENFQSPEPGMIKTEIRGPALAMSDANVDPGQFARLLMESSNLYDDQDDESDKYEDVSDETDSDGPSSPDDGNHANDVWDVPPSPDNYYLSGRDGDLNGAPPRGDDSLFVSAYLLASSGGEQYLSNSFTQAQFQIMRSGLSGGDDDIKAMAIAGLSPEKSSETIERMKWLQANLVLPNSADLAWLARSDYPLDEVKARYEQVGSLLIKEGFQEDTHQRSAAAIMAGAPYSTDVLVDRFTKLVGPLKSSFEEPQVAAAMLASTPMSPEESLHVFKEAMGVVSRGNFFDDAQEIEPLALILTNKISPDAMQSQQPAVQTTLPPQPVDGYSQQQNAQEDKLNENRRTYVPWYYWYYWNNHYYYAQTIQNVRAHPGHMHTVPYFG